MSQPQHASRPALAQAAIRKRLQEVGTDVVNEATTRPTLIDFVLEQLGWPHSAIQRESPDGAGGFLDYHLTAPHGAWMVVEAKRADTPFTIQVPGVDFSRILWALAFAKGHGLGPQTASEIARLFTTRGGLAVQPPNIGRAFRKLRDRPEACLCWIVQGKRYSITEHGERVLEALQSKARWKQP